MSRTSGQFFRSRLFQRPIRMPNTIELTGTWRSINRCQGLEIRYLQLHVIHQSRSLYLRGTRTAASSDPCGICDEAFSVLRHLVRSDLCSNVEEPRLKLFYADVLLCLGLRPPTRF